ncbi:MAG: cytochrome c [Acidobacteriota bacterium]|nr:cytochrome c [Acidobacteriota bacterium]
MRDNPTRDVPANWCSKKNGYGGAAITLMAIFSIAGSAQPFSVTQAAPADAQASAHRGEELFTGRTALRNRGPACISCHTIAGLPFPNGGTLGPDLTQVYKKLGQRGTQSAMQTLFFRVMTPIYGAHALAPEEQTDLMAFLEQAETKPQSQWGTQIIILAALVLGGFFVTLTGFLWKDRVRSVRRALIYKATGQGARF